MQDDTEAADTQRETSADAEEQQTKIGPVPPEPQGQDEARPEQDSPPTFRGHVDPIHAGAVSGWLFDCDDPGRPLTVDLLVDGVSVARQLANQPRQDAAGTGNGGDACGFLFKLDKTLLDGEPRELVAREYWTGWQIPGSPVTVQCVSEELHSRGQVRGSFDCVSDGRAQGWAYDPSRPGERLHVEVLRGETVTATGIADRFRQDLLDAEIGDGRHAFSVDVGGQEPDDAADSLSVRVRGGHRLPGQITQPSEPRPADSSDESPNQTSVQQSGLGPGNPPRPPFDNIRDTRFFFPSARHAEALSRLFMLSEDRNMGMGVLTGEIGAGKTLVRTLLYSRLSPTTYLRVSIENSLLEFDGLLLEIISQMQGQRLDTADYPDRYSLLAAFKRLLSEEVASGERHLVVLIDEAQELSGATLRALKGLTNIAPENGSYLTLILIGQPQLNTELKKLPEVEQRVSQRFHLSNLDAVETGFYIRHRLRAAGVQGEPPVTDEAIDLVYKVSRGTPREINRLCKLALNYRLTHGCGELDLDAVRAVTQDLRKHAKSRRIENHF